MQFGDFEIRTFVEQTFRLDGGSMFGVVPKSLWSRLIPADENNLIDMVTNLFVLSQGKRHILFDAGLGDTLSEREKKVYATDGRSMMDEGLASLGLTVEDIDYVILTHLHTDHAAGAVKLEGGRYVPRFPKARYVIGRSEWKTAMKPDERTSAVYSPERLGALKEAQVVDLIDADREIFHGVRTVHTGGHTSGHFGLEMESGGQKVWYYADIFCTSAHLKVAYVPATDLYPLETMEIKREKLPQIIEEQVVMAFDHDPRRPLARVYYDDNNKLTVAPVSGAKV
jgi:glyoxylase-like metal-dependent hydrolase (beta-lactamase superfamily II)